MTFKKIIIAAIEEEGGKDSATDGYGYGCNWGDIPSAHGVRLEIYFYNFQPEGVHCLFYWHAEFLFTIHEADILDPDWSPEMLAKQIDDEIACIPRV